jgi:hypothetical protein
LIYDIDIYIVLILIIKVNLLYMSPNVPNAVHNILYKTYMFSILLYYNFN